MYFVRFKNSVFIIKRNLGKLFWAVKHLIGKASGCFLMSDQDPVKKGPHVLYNIYATVPLVTLRFGTYTINATVPLVTLHSGTYTIYATVPLVTLRSGTYWIS